jgi:hypothetical protein
MYHENKGQFGTDSRRVQTTNKKESRKNHFTGDTRDKSGLNHNFERIPRLERFSTSRWTKPRPQRGSTKPLEHNQETSLEEERHFQTGQEPVSEEDSFI